MTLRSVQFAETGVLITRSKFPNLHKNSRGVYGKVKSGVI